MQPTTASSLPSKDAAELKRFLRDLFHCQSLAVVATVKGEQPFTNLVAFAAADDLQYIVFATARATRKYENLKGNPRVSITIDDRKNATADFSDAAAVMAIGEAREVTGAEKQPLVELYLKKHPYLRSFVTAPSCAMIRIDVEKYDMVQRFQNVVELECKHESGPASFRHR